MRLKRFKQLVIFFLIAILAAACQSQPAQQTAEVIIRGGLTPYYTATTTATITPTPKNAPTATLAPTFTATPQVYVIKGNDTMWTIAAKAGLTIDEIKAANPGINPYALSAGMKIVVPQAKGLIAESAATPTPLPLLADSPRCAPSLTGGIYCFAVVENNQSFPIQNLSAQFILTDPQTGTNQVQPALLPLNQFSTGAKLPLFAYFPPPISANSTAQLQILSAIPISSPDSTYLAVTLSNLMVEITSDGLSAKVSVSASPQAAATSMWIATVAYDADGNVVGVRQLEKKTNLAAGASADFSVYVYSIAGKIDHVDVYGEAAK